MISRHILLLAAAAMLVACQGAPSTVDPLPSWNAGETRKAIVSFVERATTPGGSDYVPDAERIAVFDNDGTLWAEQPLYFQFVFALDRVRALAPQHPEWQTTQPFQAVLEGDMDKLAAGGTPALLTLMLATHTGMTSAEFATTVRAWIDTARHPRTGQLYRDMVYQPMLELLAYLRAHGFRTYIVSGGGVEFMRVFAWEVYGIPPEQVLGSRLETEFVLRDGKPVFVRKPKVDFLNDKTAKPVQIHQVIGRQPIAAFGNSDGDLAMLRYTAGRRGAHLCLYVHHTDAEREWAYDRESKIGRLDQGLGEARQRGWTVVDMKRDWSRVFR